MPDRSRSARHHIRIDTNHNVVTKRARTAAGAALLKTEAAALERLSGVEGVAELVSWDGETLSTRHIEGELLLDWWQHPSPEDCRALAAALVETVSAIHARGVAHRDLAPDNILVTPAGQPVLIDLELARLPGHAHGGGTPANAAPELRWLPDPGLIDYRADVFSLGLLLKRLLLGESWGLRGEGLLELMMSTPPESTGLRAWVHAMTAPHRIDRPTDLSPLLAMLRGQDGGPPSITALTLPSSLQDLVDEVVDEVGEDAREALTADLAALAPIGALIEDVAQERWLSWARALARARMLRAQGDDAALWEAAELELMCGLPWRFLSAGGGPAAALALRLDAPHAARTLLGGVHAFTKDGVRLALYAAATGRLGDTVEAAKAFSAALQNRPTDLIRLRPFWDALCRVLLYTGSLSDLIQLVPTLPAPERGGAIESVLPSLSRLLDTVAGWRDHRLRHAGAQQPFVALAMGTTLRELALILGELSLWVVAAQVTGLPTASWLQQAGTHLSDETPKDTVGHVFLVAAAVLRQNAEEQARAFERLRALRPDAPPLREWTVLADWVRQVMEPPQVVLPSWVSNTATESEAPATVDERVPMALLHQQGSAAALEALHDLLIKAPRSPRLWSATLQICCVELKPEQPKRSRDFKVLLDALSDAGMGPQTLLPWRMQGHLRAGQPRQALEALIAARRCFPLPWPALLLSIDSWMALGERDRAREALPLLEAANAPAAIVKQARAALQ